MSTWPFALREFEASLDRIEAAIEAGDVDGVTVYRPPRGLPELTVEHREWADRLAMRNEVLVRAVSRLLAENPPPPVSASMGSSAPTGAARFEYLA